MTESNSCCFCFGGSKSNQPKNSKKNIVKHDASMLLAFERRDELEKNAENAKGLVNETTLVTDSLIKSGLTNSRFYDSR